MAQANSAQNHHAVSRAEKYLTFNLGSEQYGIEILKVREIIGMMDITRVPRTPDFVRGVINLRGKVIPVIHLRTKFGMDSVEETDQTCIIVVDFMGESSTMQMGIFVDSVSEVIDIDNNDIEDTPSFGSVVSTDFIQGIAKTKGGVKILLNIEKVLSTSEIQSLPKVSVADAPTDKK
jgi:purine-binding chemotaxis protein CheW